MATDKKVIELKEELKCIKWDVIGISKVRRKGEEQLTLNSVMFYTIVEKTHQYEERAS